jgi:FkbM family methyltransferase
MSLRSQIKALVRRFGYEIRRVRVLDSTLGHDPFNDMRYLTGELQSPVVFDVGANIGQSINTFRKYFRTPLIHSFEPSPSTYQELVARHAKTPDAVLNNMALGAKTEKRVLVENSQSVMSSILEPAADCWGEITQRTTVEVSTIDDYCYQREIRGIDILKTDTQGFDLEVLKGANRKASERRIHLIYLELNFSDMYKGQPQIDEIYRFLHDWGFALVSLYDIFYQNDRAGWADALFVNHNYDHPGSP